MSTKVAVVLCGSGYKDGSEIRESVGVLWALSQLGAEAQCFAPNANQLDVVNCLTGETMPETRNMLIEAARIARGEILPLDQLRTREFHALILPGGFGAAKNLCTFAKDGSKGSVLPALKILLHEFYSARKPIGAVCIAPAILALAFPNQKLRLTLGTAGEAAQEIKKLGHSHQVCSASECVADSEHRIATTPAYMHDTAKLHDIFSGVLKTAEAVLKWAH